MQLLCFAHRGECAVFLRRLTLQTASAFFCFCMAGRRSVCAAAR